MLGKSKLQILTLSLGLSIVLSASALAQAAAAAAPQSAAAPAGTGGVSTTAKIGIVNIQDAIIATNEGKKEFDALQTRFQPRQNDLKVLNDEVENLKKDLQAKSDKLNEDERSKQVKNLETKQKTLQRNYEDAQNEFQQAEQSGRPSVSLYEGLAAGHASVAEYRRRLAASYNTLGTLLHHRPRDLR